MGDYTVSGFFEISADPTTVMERLSSTEGIASWWSNTVDGNASTVGDEFSVGFPDAPFPFGFTVRSAESRSVSWLVGEMPPPWAGTTISFDVKESDEGGSDLLFTHSGFEPENEIIPVVTPAWMAIVSKLKANVESGGNEPFFTN